MFPSSEYEQSEAPVFLFAVEGRTVGVEIMDYHQGPMTEKGSPMRRLEEQRSRAVFDASRTYEERHPNGPALEVDVAFRRDAEPGTRFPESLASFVAGNLPGE